ncbi:MAG: tyrosine-type recombinase/integrase [Thermoproteota archaeon]|nr:tyrosine-type recombinase/integrase [Thermoproteota archaeon]
MSLQRYESNFINSIRTAATRKSYQFYFEKYRKFALGNVIDDRLIIENQIVDFLLSLKNRGLSYHSVKCYFSAIAHFYIMNDIVLNRKKIIKFINTDAKKKSKNAGYTIEQIHKLLDVCDERTKAIILIYASTGMRLAALPALKIGDLTGIDQLYQITVYQGYKEEYITFCTPECRNVIYSYLLYRRRCGEEIKSDAPLIREQFDATDSFRVKHPKHVSLKTIAKILRQKAIQAGMRKVDHIGNNEGSKMRKDIPLIHGFRKFFNTALMNADVNLSFKELLMGHSVKLDDVYYDKNSGKSQTKLLEEYSKAIEYLTINEENRLRKKVEVLKAKRDEIEILKGQVQQKDDRLSVIEKQMQSLVSTLSKLTEQGQVNTVAQTLYSSGILKEGKETTKQ